MSIIADFYGLLHRYHAKTSLLSFHKEDHPLILEMVALGPDILPIIFKELRGDPRWVYFILLRELGMGPIVVPEESRGKLYDIARLWLAWIDKYYPPTAQDYFEASKIAQSAGDEHFENAIRPIEKPYTKEYSDSCLDGAKEYYQRASDLRLKAIGIETQTCE